MIDIRFVINAIILLTGIISLLTNTQKWRAAKKAAGEIKRCWSTKLDPRIPRNRLNWLIIILYWAVNIYYMTSVHGGNIYFPFVFFVFAMSFAPRWNAAIGSRGIALGTRMISWEEIIEKEIVKKGSRCTLILKRASSTDRSGFSRMVIPCPDDELF